MTILEINGMLGTNYSDKEDFLKWVNWSYISEYRKLSENFIQEFQDKVDWSYISMYQKLSEGFIREFQDKVYWDYISVYQKLSESFIREFRYDVDWWYISKYQVLSEGFIGEFQSNVDWCIISAYQKLSEGFIREFQYRVDWFHISRCQKLSPEFQEKFAYKLLCGLVVENWIYKDTEFKKKAVMDTKLYECHEDYFIAYKGIRKDRYSKINFQYQYLKGETYSSWCDCSDYVNSFGLSVWTEKMAREYCPQLVVRVKIKYEDVGRVVHDGGKVRCFKIEILD